MDLELKKRIDNEMLGLDNVHVCDCMLQRRGR